MGENLGKGGWEGVIAWCSSCRFGKTHWAKFAERRDALIRIVAGGSPPRPDVMMAEFYVC